MKLAIAAALFGTVVAGSAQAQSLESYSGPPAAGEQAIEGYSSWDQARIGHYRRTLEALRKEALQLQQADGGRLTATHEGYIQGKIDSATRELAYETNDRYQPTSARPAQR